MKNKFKFLGIIAIIAIIGFSMLACGEGDETTDPALNGTWVSEDGETIKLNNGSFEFSDGDTPYMKGTYTASNGDMTMKITHIWGGYTDAFSGEDGDDMGFDFGLDAKWYTQAQFKKAIEDAFADLKDLLGDDVDISEMLDFDEMLDEMFAEHTGKYSVDGDTLTLTVDGEEEATEYTRKK